MENQAVSVQYRRQYGRPDRQERATHKSPHRVMWRMSCWADQKSAKLLLHDEAGQEADGVPHVDVSMDVVALVTLSGTFGL